MGNNPVQFDPFHKSVIILYSIIILLFIGVNNNDLGNKDQRAESVNIKEEDNSDDSGIINWMRNFISMYYPVFFGSLLLLLSNTFKDKGYANLFFLVLLISYLSSYTLSQSMLYHNIETNTKTDDCSFKLPSSNMFETKEITFFRFIYSLTIIIICICMSGIGSGYYSFLSPYIFLIPFIFPIATEVISYIVNQFHRSLDDDDDKANIRPEQLLIQFMRGKHTGITSSGDSDPEFKDRNWFITTGDGKDEANEKGVAFINTHLIYSMLFYGMLMWYVLIYSYDMPFSDSELSSTPLTFAITILLGYPIFMKYIFIQECSVNTKSDNLPDGIYDPDDNTIKEASDYETRFNKKEDILCHIEKYGGIQLLLCLSFLILIITNITEGRDKLLVLVTAILTTYGLSQTFYSIEKKIK